MMNFKKNVILGTMMTATLLATSAFAADTPSTFPMLEIQKNTQKMLSLTPSILPDLQGNLNFSKDKQTDELYITISDEIKTEANEDSIILHINQDTKLPMETVEAAICKSTVSVSKDEVTDELLITTTNEEPAFTEDDILFQEDLEDGTILLHLKDGSTVQAMKAIEAIPASVQE